MGRCPKPCLRDTSLKNLLIIGCERWVVLAITLLILIEKLSLPPHPTALRLLLLFLLSYCFSFFSFMRRDVFLPPPYDGWSLSSGHNALCPSSKAYMSMSLCILPFLGLGFALLLGCLDSIPFLLVGVSHAGCMGIVVVPPQDFLG